MMARSYPELISIKSDRILVINDYHGLYPKFYTKKYDYVVYSSFGEYSSTNQLNQLLERFNSSFIIVITTQEYIDIPHKTDRYQILKIPSAYAQYSRHIPYKNINVNSRALDKTFLSLNNRANWPRQALTQFMLQYDIMKNSYFSYHCQDREKIGQRNVFDECNSIIGKTWFNHRIDNEKLYEMLPITTKIDKFNSNDWTIGNSIYYESSFCSVVLETYADQNFDPFFTEKTMKPLAFGHPFLLFSSAGALQKIKHLGFETFSDCFDEEYDRIEHPIERFEHILREIIRLNSLSKEEITSLHLKLIPKLEHNINHFWNILPEQYNKDIQNIKQQILDIVLH
jgi:hypothetical protein